MKRTIIYLTIVCRLLCNETYAQTDSTCYFLNKNSMTTNVLYPLPDSVYFGLYNGSGNKTCSNLFTLQILDDLKNWAINPEQIISSDTILNRAVTQVEDSNVIPLARVSASAIAKGTRAPL
jgi:hypothetical protein